jgi:heme-degrading monooxygenase HmoA
VFDAKTKPGGSGEKLSDDKIIAMLSAGVRQSVGYSDSRLSRERLKISKYKDGLLPTPLHPGNSKYVSTDVYDGVESMKAQLLEVFSGNTEPVQFAPVGPQDVDAAREGTAYTNYVVFRENPGFLEFQDVIEDGLTGRAGVAKVWWESMKDYTSLTLSDTTYEALAAHLMQNPDHTPTKITQSEDGGIKRVEIEVEQDKSQTRIRVMPPEEFFISPRSVSLKTAELCGHRYRATMSDLIKSGYSKAKLDALGGKDDLWRVTDPELIERHQKTDDVMSESVWETEQDARKTITVYECYCELDMTGEGRSKLYQVIYAGTAVLKKTCVPRRPFISFVPLPRPHAFWGTNYAALLVDIQNARTALTRSIIDHALITTNPRMVVVKGAVSNPRELMENRIGGIVNVSRPDGLFPLPQAGLNPFIFQTISQLDEDKEQRTGISKLSQGLNKDAISKQNSAAMVEQLVSVSQVRQKIVARNFAEGFLTDLFLEVYRLGVENETSEKMIQIAGSFHPVDPSTWPDRDHLIVNFALGYGEQEKEAAKYVNMDKMLSADPRLARMYPEATRFHVISRALKGFGISDITLTDPSTLPPPQPTPDQQADLQVKMSDSKVKEANAQAATMKVQLDQTKATQDFQVEMRRLDLEEQKIAAAAQKESDHISLERDKLAHKVAVDAAEIALQKAAQEAGKVEAFAQPTH